LYTYELVNKGNEIKLWFRERLFDYKKFWEFGEGEDLMKFVDIS
jgi:hypothetical protein